MNDFMKSVTVGFIFRLGIIMYSEWHDQNLYVPFTDVDYKVFSDAAQYVSESESPYKKHTYRYSPILAWLLVPNVYFPMWGKILFSSIDLCTSALIKSLVRFQGFSELAALRCAQVWIFNPLSITISARGNSDSLISFTVLASIFFLLNYKHIWAGFFLALSIHIRLYPIAFSLPMYLSLKPVKIDSEAPYLKKLSSSFKRLYPNKKQINLTVSCITSLIFLTSLCYYIYGMEYLQESIFYHLNRKDIKHNFSVYFYLLYLEPNQPFILLFLPQLILLIILAFMYGHKSTLLFCLFAQTFVMVSYNPVVTSQYFIWYLSLLIASLPRFDLNFYESIRLTLFWLFAQFTWLLPAYLLEFHGRNTFLFIWFQGIGFFCANISVLIKLIKSYKIEVNVERLKTD